ncbi:DUF7144 family membrane protein [Leifsonia poae]|uniref:DUF7144 domain-containing protein n=1 Tax=Leifsonia poae TaxID=110933 RepID=A0A9W6HA59_9MICO|nr:hypothetical protein [Leifsonia poae]GLJ76182.1 hypothetical protein GCM10017584_17560 [Leifsonia poae]
MTTAKDLRPRSVTVAAALTWLSGTVNLVTGVLLLFQLGNADLVARFGNAALVIVMAVAVMILGVVILIVSSGLFRGSNGARIVATIFQSASILAAIALSIRAPSFLLASVVSIVVSITVIASLFNDRAAEYFRAS